MADPDRRIRAARVSAVGALVVIAIVMVVGTLGDGGFSSPWLWIGLALVPVLLWLVRRADWHR